MIIEEKLKILIQNELTKKIIKNPLYIENNNNNIFNICLLVNHNKVNFLTVRKISNGYIHISWKKELILTEYRLEFKELVNSIFDE